MFFVIAGQSVAFGLVAAGVFILVAAGIDHWRSLHVTPHFDFVAMDRALVERTVRLDSERGRGG